MQFGQQRVIGVPVNQLDLHVFFFFEQFGQMLGSNNTAITAAQNYDFLQEIHLLILGWVVICDYFADSSALVTSSKKGCSVIEAPAIASVLPSALNVTDAGSCFSTK
ncbi:hypothetical protein D3C74_219000 [compost metagenome]